MDIRAREPHQITVIEFTILISDQGIMMQNKRVRVSSLTGDRLDTVLSMLHLAYHN